MRPSLIPTEILLDKAKTYSEDYRKLCAIAESLGLSNDTPDLQQYLRVMAKIRIGYDFAQITLEKRKIVIPMLEPHPLEQLLLWED